MSRPSTGSQRLAEVLIDRPLADYLTEKRLLGLSYERISRDLHSDTEGQVSVSLRTIQRWCDSLKVSA